MNSVMGMNGCRHPLSYLLEAADDIAYRTSDLEDAIVKKVIRFQQIADVFYPFMEQADSKNTKEVRDCINRLLDFYQELFV